jgi:NADH dehydrogenase FAD-containing subunit
VAIVGLGDTGVLAAVALSRRFEVVGIATRPALVSGQELGARLADLDGWRRNYLLPLDRFTRLQGARVVHGRATSVDLGLRTVTVERAAGGSEVVPYDALVVASGVTNGFWRHDRVQDLAEVDRELAEAADRLAQAPTIAVVGGGATGVSAAVSLARRHPAAEVHLFHSRAEPLPEYHPRVRARVLDELRSAGVRLHAEHRAVLPSPDEQRQLGAATIEWSTGREPFAADVVLWATGQVEPHTGFLPAELLDGDGFVRVDEHLQVPGHERVFAVGDVAASDPGRTSARNWGAQVVARNVAASLGHRPSRRRTYRAPEHRWGSVLGVQDDGMLVFQPSGRGTKVPRGMVQPLLFDLWLRRVLYRGVRR